MISKYLFSFVAVSALVILFLLNSSAALDDVDTQKITPHLQLILHAAPEDQMIDVYVMLEGRLTYPELRSMTQGLKRKERQKEVVRILKSHAENSQSRIKDYLIQTESRGLAERVNNIWAINTIAFSATPSVINDMARNFDEVEMIFYDKKIPPEEAQDVVVGDDPGSLGRSRDGSLALQPGLILINAEMVWMQGDSGQGIVVSNVDGGCDWRHPDLINNIWNNLGEDYDGDGRTLEWNGSSWIFDPGDVNGVDDDANGYIDDFIGWNLSNNTNDPSTSASYHGTCTAGIVCGDGTNGTQTGVAPRAKLMNLNIASAGYSGWLTAYQYAFANGADITTSSYSEKWPSQPNYPAYRAMTDMELAAGVLHTNSTSNDGNNLGSRPIPFNISAPGNCPPPWLHPDQTLIGGVSSVVGVGNVNAISDVIESSSPYGPSTWEDIQVNHPSYPYTMPLQYQDYPYETQPGSIGLLKPDVSSPGNGTTSTAPGGGYQSFSGTSGATPHVAGTAALLLAANPDLEPADLARILQLTAVEKGAPGKDPRYGAGRIDAYAAYLQAVAEAGAPYPPTNLTAYSDYTTPTSMLLNWENPTHLQNGDPLTPDAFSIVIYRDEVYVDSIPGTNSDYTDTGLNDGQEYIYEIYAVVDTSGRASGSVSASWIAGGSPIPNPPTNFSVSGSQNEVTFSWFSPTTNIDGTPMDDYIGVNVYQNGSLVTTFTRTTSDTGMADSDTYTVNPPGYYDWFITAIDNENPVNESDSTVTLGTPLSLPILDEFAVAGEPNPGIWINTNTDVNDGADTPPSAPYALNLNGKPNGEDIVDLRPLDLSGMQGTNVFLSYYYQPQGTGNAPEPEDSLRVYFKNDLGDWVLVKAYEGTTVQPFAQEVIDIGNAPAGGGSHFHGQFQVRFRSTGGSGTFPNDNWFVDDVVLDIPVGIEEETPVPLSYAISRNYPNPFNPTTTIKYQLPQTSDVKLAIYNVLGQRVRTLVNGRIEAGYHSIEWDGRNEAGAQVASGIYIYRFSADNYLKVQKMILMK